LPARNWDVTRTRTHEVWELAKQSNSKSLIEDKLRQYGLRDTVNDYFHKKMQSAHNKLTQEAAEHLFDELKIKQGVHLFNPMLRLQGA
jgi:hypothetical protein